MKRGTVIQDRNGTSGTKQEPVLNQGGNINDLQLSKYVDGKIGLVDITNNQTGLKGVTQGKAPIIDDEHVEMVIAAGKIAVT